MCITTLPVFLLILLFSPLHSGWLVANDLHYVVIELFTKDTWAVEDEQENAASQLTNRRIRLSPSTSGHGESASSRGRAYLSLLVQCSRSISYWKGHLPLTSCRLSLEQQQLRTDAGDEDQ